MAVTQLGLDDLRREQELGMGGLPVDTNLGFASPKAAPSVVPSVVGSAVPGGTEPTYGNLFGSFGSGPNATGSAPATIGDEPGQVRFEDLQAAGGVEGVQRSQLGERSLVQEGLAVTENLLGRPSNIQRAQPDVAQMSGWQKASLFVADMIAMGEGRPMPSATLRLQHGQFLSLQEQANQEMFVKAAPAMAKFVETISALNPADRKAAAESIIPQFAGVFGEGFAGILHALSANETAGESLAAFIKNKDNFKGGPSENILNLSAFLATNHMDEAIKILADAGLSEDGAFEQEARYQAPALLDAKMPGFISELRGMGGDSAAFATKLERGDTVSPAEIINRNKSLPINSENRFDDIVYRTLATKPMLFGPNLPGIRTPEFQEEYNKMLAEGELSAPVNFVHPTLKPSVVTAPQTGNKARQLMRNGYQVLDRLTALGGGGVNAPSMSEINSVRQEFLKQSESFQTINEKWAVVQAAMDESNPISHISLIFAYMKILDPGSTVREGEQLTVQQAKSFSDKVLNMHKQVLAGQKLTPPQIREIHSASQKIWYESASKQTDRESIYWGLAGLMKVDPRLIVMDLIGRERNASGVNTTQERRVPTDADIQAAEAAVGGDDPDALITYLEGQGFSLDQ